MTVAVPTITDVVFDFCGVLLDWRTRACLEGRFDDATVDRICADDDPCGFFGYEDRMDAGEDFDSIWPDVVAEQQKVADAFYELKLIPKHVQVKDIVWQAPQSK